MRLAYVGNHSDTHSTETKIAAALERLGHEVWRLHEPLVEWSRLEPAGYDAVLWTRTRTDCMEQTQFLNRAKRDRVPTVAIHLDLFFGLRRAHLIEEVPFFRCSQVWSADGGNAKRWRAAGIDHRWMPPAADPQPEPARFAIQWAVGLFGSLDGYHREHAHRAELIGWLRANYGPMFAHFGRGGRPDVRGSELSAAMAACRVVVGDSCATPHGRYWSDRVPETLARGAVLIHTDVDGLREAYPTRNLVLWPQGDFNALRAVIESAAAMRLECRDPGWLALGKNTWEERMREMLAGL